MLSIREHTDDDGKTQQISSSVFPEFSDLYLVFKKVVPFPDYYQPLGVRRRNPKKVSQKNIIPKENKTLQRLGLYHLKGSFYPR